MEKENILNSPNIISFSTSGICMKPLIKAGNTLIVKLFTADNVIGMQPGDIIVYKHQGKIFAHRFVVSVLRGNQKIFVTRNNRSLFLTPIEASNAIGKVISIIRNSRLKNPRSNFLQILIDRLLCLLYLVVKRA